MPAPVWPPSDNWLHGLLVSPESRLTEFKREWYDLEKPSGKAELTKDIIAMANSVEPDQMGSIVIGIEDPTRGAVLRGVTKHPAQDQIAQVLASYSEPVPQAEYVALSYHATSVGVIGVFSSPHRPHYVTRDVPGILSRSHVYLRRGASVGIATWPEVEALIRAKGARLDTSLTTEPIQAGFVELEAQSVGGIVARVTNVSAEPVTGVDVFVDATMPALPGAFCREFRYGGARLEPGASLEAKFSLLPDDFVYGDAMLGLEWRGRAATRILDLVLVVQYRDRNGLIRRIEQRAARRG